MGSKAQQARVRIIEAADALFYAQGFDNTSFADIADTVQISRGNFYYHFKSKDDILEAVINKRVQQLENIFTQWSADISGPEQRLLHYIDMITRNRGNIQQHGCPIGSLCSELAKLAHNKLSDANRLLTVSRDWLVEQLMSLLGRAQGIATITYVFSDPAFLDQEVMQLKQWLLDSIRSHT
jgi:AcrR family transcriptional regulator